MLTLVFGTALFRLNRKAVFQSAAGANQQLRNRDRQL